VKNPGLFPLRRGRVSFYQLEMPTGLVHGVVDISTLIGIVALCLFAGAFATEFSQGTMRNLLVREPRRAQLLTGKFLAIAVFIGVAVVLEIVVSCAVAFILAPGRGITTSAWTSSTGINDLLQATLHVFLASVGYGMLGAALGVLLRSPGVAIGAAVAYVVAIEGIVVGAIWSNGDRWLPGQLLSAVAHGGTTDSSYHHSLITLAVYMVLIAAGTLIVFTRRDAS
jgi:ABC-type transport system involved in multi-copper enzyme maturation permease subunit